MAALIACVGHAYFAGRYLVGENEDAAVRTGVGAKALLPKKYTVIKPQMKRNGIATATEGKVAQKSVVTR